MGTDHVRNRSTADRRRLLLRLLPAALALAAFQVGAASWTDGGGWKAPPMGAGPDGIFQVLPESNSPNNQHVTTCTSSSCTRVGDLPAPIGRGNPRLSPSASFPKANIASAAVALGGRVLPWLSLGMGLYDWYRAANLNPDESSPSGFSEDVGGSSAVAGYWAFNSNPAQRFGTSTAACDFALQEWVSAYSTGSNVIVSQSNSMTVVNSNRVNCPVTVTYKASPSATVTSTASNTYTINRTLGDGLCADISTQLVSANGIGGVCPGPVKTPLTETQLADRLNNANVSNAALAKALEEVLKAGGTIQDTGTHSVTGPSSVPGETTTKTTTAPNGTTQVTTVTNNYNYTYNGNVVTVTTTTVTQNPDGSTETETSNQPEMDACTSNPTSAACTKLGDPTAAELPTNTKNVTFAPVSFSANQSCPGPVQFNALGRQLEFSYTPMCDTISTWIRALVLAGCAFIAAYVFIGGLKA